MIYDLYLWWTKGNTYVDRSCFTWGAFIAIMTDDTAFSTHYRGGDHSYSIYFSEALSLAQIFRGKVKYTPGRHQFGEGGKL